MAYYVRIKAGWSLLSLNAEPNRAKPTLKYAYVLQIIMEVLMISILQHYVRNGTKFYVMLSYRTITFVTMSRRWWNFKPTTSLNVNISKMVYSIK